MQGYTKLGWLSRFGHEGLTSAEHILRQHPEWINKISRRLTNVEAWHRNYKGLETVHDQWDYLGSLLKDKPSYYLPLWRYFSPARAAVWCYEKDNKTNSNRFAIVQLQSRLELYSTETVSPVQISEMLSHVFLITHLPLLSKMNKLQRPS